MKRIVSALCAAIALLIPASVDAQWAPERVWGLRASFVPTWEVRDTQLLKDVVPFALTGADDGVSIDGSDFRVGFVRGNRLGGDAGVSFVRRSFVDGSYQGFVHECPDFSGCYFGTQYVYRGVTLTGIEAHKFAPFATIKEKVQIGIEFAGGVGRYTGTVESHTGIGLDVVTETVEARVLNNLADSVRVVPIGRVELAVAGILPAGFKVRVSGGINFPGQHIASVTLVYLFGE